MPKSPLAPLAVHGPPAEWPAHHLLALLVPGGVALPDLADWCSLEPHDLAFRHGMEARDAWRLCAAIELGRRAALAVQPVSEPLRGGAEVHALLRPSLVNLTTECFHALYVDAKGRLLHQRPISHGTLTSALVHPREVFAPAVAHRAAAVIVAHNHPSGDPEPSEEDRATTRRLLRAGRLLGIELLDHVVIARGGYVSFLERGWLGAA